MSTLQELAKGMLSEEAVTEEQPLDMQKLANDIISFNKERPIAGPDINRLLPIEEEVVPPDEFDRLPAEFQSRTPVKDSIKEFAKSLIGVPPDTTVSLFDKPEEELEFGEENMGALPNSLKQAFDSLGPSFTALSSPVTLSTNAILASSGNKPKERLKAMANILTLSPEEGDELFVGDMLQQFGITDKKLDGIIEPIIGPGFMQTAGMTEKIGLLGDFIGFSKFDKAIGGLLKTGNAKTFSKEIATRVSEAKRAGKVANADVVLKAGRKKLGSLAPPVAIGAGITGSLALLSGQEAEGGVLDKIIQFPKKAAKKTIDVIDPLTKFPQKPVNKLANGFRIHNLVKERVFNINEAFLESEKFIVDFKVNLSLAEREALPFIRQGMTHDAKVAPKRLKKILAKIGKEKLFEIIKNPSEKLLKYNEKLGKYYDDAHQMLSEVFDDIGFIEDYVTQIWDIPKNRKSEVINYFATHNPFTKKRKIPTLDVGIKLGLKPKHLDIVKLLQAYDQYKIKTVFNNRFAEALNAMTDAETGIKLVQRRDIAPYDWIVVDHPALNRAMAIGQTTVKVSGVHLQTIIKETMEKVVTIEKTVSGGTVKQSTSKPVRALEGVITEALTARGMTKGEASVFLSKIKSVYAGAKVEAGIVGETSKEKITKGTKVIVNQIDSKFPVNVPILKEVPVKVHPEIAKEVQAVFSSRFTHNIIGPLETVNAFAKKGMLSFSFFHHFALTESAFSSGIGPKAIKMWNPYKVYRALKNKDFEVFKSMPAAKDAIQHGVTFGPLSDFMVTKVRQGMEAVERATRKVPVVGRTAKLARQANDLWDSALWDYYHNTLKLYAYENHVHAALKRAGKKAKRELTPTEIKEIKEGVADFVNNSFGGQNWELQPFFRHAKNRQMMQWALLSPDWTVSVLKQAFAPVKGHRQAVAGGSIERRLAGKALSRRAHMFWLKAAVYYNIIAQSANYYNTGKYEWKNGEEVATFRGTARFTYQNAPGHKLDIFAGFNDDGTERYIRMGKQFREVMEWSYEPELKLGAKLSPITRQTIAQFAKHDPGSGFPTSYKDLPFYKSLKPRAKEALVSLLPFSFRGLIEEKSLQPFLFALPTSRGMTRAKTIREFKKAIEDGDQAREFEVGLAALKNNLNADELYSIAMSSLKGDGTKEAKEVARWVFKTVRKYPKEARGIVYQRLINQGIITPKVRERLLKMKVDRESVRGQRRAVGFE